LRKECDAIKEVSQLTKCLTKWFSDRKEVERNP
jgi:hypothetical protein